MRDTLSAYTTFGIGGRAKRIETVISRGALADIPCGSLILGVGSNVLASDSGYDGVAYVNRYVELKRFGVLVTAGSGTRLGRLCAFAAENGLSGLEWAAGIPGSVGGAVRMNAGAFGGSVAQVLVYADIVRGGRIMRLSNAELHFGYRRSAVTATDIVLGAAFGLKYDSIAEIKKRMQGNNAMRRHTQPVGKSAGSIFKNPDGVAIGRVLEDGGFKGMRVGGAVVSPRHANIIVNTGGATARDVNAIIAAEQRYLTDLGITAEQEIIHIGDPD